MILAHTLGRWNRRLWISRCVHFDSELDGYEMFREHFYRHFGSEEWKYLEGAEEPIVADKIIVDPVTFISPTLLLGPAKATVPGGNDGMEMPFDVPDVKFGE